MNKTLLERAMNLFQAPFYYDDIGGIIKDVNNKIVIYTGEWGEVQEYRELHIELGEHIAEVMNRSWKQQENENGFLDSDFGNIYRDELQKKLRIKIQDLDFSSSTIEACKAVGVRLVNDLMIKDATELESDKFSLDSIMEVELVLESLGLYMGMELPQ